MSSNWVIDIADMHVHYDMDVAFDKIVLDKEKAKKLLEFRINFLQEELDEMKAAESAEDVVDALIDLCVVAIGTLDAFGVDSYQAWDNVLDANMQKRPGIKESRPNPLGLPDLIKPEGWQAPSHKGNHGDLDIIFSED